MPAGNHLQFGPDGKAKFKSGKALFAADGTPCCCTTPCSLCNTNGSPSTVVVRLAGFSWAAGCYSTSGGALSVRVNSFSINGDFCLPQISSTNPCHFCDIFSGHIDSDHFCSSVNNSCTGSADYNAVLIRVQAFIQSSLNRTWRVVIEVVRSAAADCLATLACMDSVVVAQMISANATDHCLDTIALDSVSAHSGIVAGTVTVIPNGC